MIYIKIYLTFADVLSNRQESLPYLWFSTKYPKHCKDTRSSLAFYCWLIKDKGTVELVFH